MGELFRRLRYLMNRRRFDEELANDIEFHREMAARDSGMPVGNSLHWREESRDAWGWTWIDRFFQDLHYALRMIRKSPGFTLAAVLMLAIGIGANVAVFSFFDLMVLRPLNVREPSTLLRFHRRSPQMYAFALPYPEMDFFRRYSKTLTTVFALNYSKLSMEGEGQPIKVQFVTGNYLSELGAQPQIGRILDAERDDVAGAEAMVVLSHGFWQRHFGGDASVIGRVIRLDGKPATVIGVATRGFGGLSMEEPALWAPIQQQPYFSTGSKLLTDWSVESSGVLMFGRLRPGSAPRAAEEELRSLAAEMRRQQPKFIWENESLPSDPGGYAKSLTISTRRGTGSEGTSELYPILGLVGTLVLLILAVACGNLGSLLLARGAAREKELSIRTAVGAGAGRLIRQLFTESLLLGFLGSVAGLGVGYLVLRGLMSATGEPPWLNPAPDWWVILFSLGMGFAAAILFGLMPAWQVARRRQKKSRSRNFLVGAQVAASCVLLIVAGLLGRALDHAVSANPGYEFQQAISITPGLGQHGYSPAKARAWLDTFTARLRAIPGVQSVSLASKPPLGNSSTTAGLEIEGHEVSIELNRVDEEFLQTMKIPVLRGRNLRPGETRTVVVSESMARKAWPGQDPLGKKFPLDDGYTVVGVAGNARMIRMEDSDMVEVYLPIKTVDLPGVSVIAKTAGRPEDLARSAAVTAKDIDAEIFPEIQLLKSQFRKKLERAEYSAIAVTALGGVAHLLACLGIVGVVSFAVAQRTREIGIRMALGAKTGQILGSLLRQFSWPVVIGLAVGIGGAVALARVLRGTLYGISHLDPIAYASAIVLFLVTVAVAAVLPARRALRIDPWRALRHD